MNDYIFEKPLFDQPCFYTIEQRIQIIKTAIDKGMNFHEIGNLFGVSSQAIKYQWKRYYLKTYVPKKQKPKKIDVYKEFKKHYDEVMK